mgnify:CR=1 FL=1
MASLLDSLINNGGLPPQPPNLNTWFSTSYKPKVFVSFDYENDKHYKFLLQAWDANPNFDFYFSDLSSQEINSLSIPVVKQKLSQKINEATYTLVIVGKEANKQHKDHKDMIKESI